MTTLEVLRKAREVIANPEHWTRGAYAKDVNGNEVNFAGKTACKFCAAGAIFRAHGGNYAIQALTAELPKTSNTVITFNDWSRRKHSEVLALYDRAIATLEAQQAEGAREEANPR